MLVLCWWCVGVVLIVFSWYVGGVLVMGWLAFGRLYVVCLWRVGGVIVA